MSNQKSIDSSSTNPLTGGSARSGTNRIRTNLLSIYNRGNPFSPILEESSEDNSNRSFSNLSDQTRNHATIATSHHSSAPVASDTTFTRSPGSQLLPRRKFDYSFYSDQSSYEHKITLDSSTQTDSDQVNKQTINLSKQSDVESGVETTRTSNTHSCSTNTEPDLNKAFVESQSQPQTHLTQSSSHSHANVQTHAKLLNEKTLQILSELLLDTKNKSLNSTSPEVDDSKLQSKQLHGVIQLENLLVNVNVRVGYRDANNEKKEETKAIPIDFDPASASTPAKVRPKLELPTNDESSKNDNPVVESIVQLDPISTDEVDKMDFDKDTRNVFDSNQSSCSSSDLTFVKRRCQSLTEFDFDQVNRFSAITVAVRVRPFTRNELVTSRGATLLNLNHAKNQVEVFDKNDFNKLKYLFKFDFCFGDPFMLIAPDEQLKIYEQIGRPFIENVFKGYNLCYFAYGQTGSGKSHTMMGDAKEPGLITRFARDLFSIIDWHKGKVDTAKSINPPILVRNRTFTKEDGFTFDQKSSVFPEEPNKSHLDSSYFKRTGSDSFSSTTNKKSSINEEEIYGILSKSRLEEIFGSTLKSEIKIFLEISFYEIHNERIYDLLDESNNHKFTSKVREHPTQGPYIVGLTVKQVNSIDQLLYFYNLGVKRRSTSSSSLNEHSSRSHAIFTINFTFEKVQSSIKTVEQIRSKINFVDLAGSERSSSQSTGDRLKEGNLINKSLLTLGQVITKLSATFRVSHSNSQSKSSSLVSESSKLYRSASSEFLHSNTGFIPYRDSVLTWLLKDCLGGNSKTVMIATVAPNVEHYEQTLCTLRYAQKAARIVNHIRVNHSYLAATSRYPHLIHPEAFKPLHKSQTQKTYTCSQSSQASSLNLVDKIRLLFSNILEIS